MKYILIIIIIENLDINKLNIIKKIWYSYYHKIIIKT